MKHTLTFLTALLLTPLAGLHAAKLPATVLRSPMQVWADYDPNKGEFKEEIVKQETHNGIFHRDSYISAYVLGEEVRVYCRYSVKRKVADRSAISSPKDGAALDRGAIPSKLGQAKATAKAADIRPRDAGIGAWSHVAEVEGVGGIKGFRCRDNERGASAEIASDSKWRAPSKGKLGFKFYCTQPQTLILTAGDYRGEIEITASDDWQELVIPAKNLISGTNKKSMADWK